MLTPDPKKPAAVEKFTFGDQIYYRQYRTCEQPDCLCQRGRPEDSHAPVWVARSTHSPEILVLGQHLPKPVSQARERYLQIATRLEKKASQCRLRLALLEKLLARGALEAQDEVLLAVWGID